MEHSELFDAGICGVRSILVTNPCFAGVADDVLAVMRGEKIAVVRSRDELRRPITRDEVAALFGITKATVDYHAAKGRLVRVRIPGSSRSRGFTRESVEACFGAPTAQGGAA